MRNTYLWLLQLLTGGLLFIFAGIHMMQMHLDNILGFFGVHIGEVTSWASMMERAGQSYWLAFYIVFLALVLYHGLNGLRGIILELARTPKAERIVTGFVLAFGVVTFSLGIYVPVALFVG